MYRYICKEMKHDKSASFSNLEQAQPLEFLSVHFSIHDDLVVALTTSLYLILWLVGIGLV